MQGMLHKNSNISKYDTKNEGDLSTGKDKQDFNMAQGPQRLV